MINLMRLILTLPRDATVLLQLPFLRISQKIIYKIPGQILAKKKKEKKKIKFMNESIQH